MKDSDLLKKISQLREIKPDTTFGSLSRGLITNNQDLEVDKDLKETLVRLRQISPDASYAFRSKREILETKKKIALSDIFKKNTVYSFAMGLATILVVIMAGISSYLRTPVSSLLSDADNNDLIKEAGNINKDIDIHLQEINYYAISASKSNVALNEASTSNTDHVNYDVIQNEADKTNYNSGEHNEKVDQLLNQASN